MALTLPVLLTSTKPAVPLDGFVHPDFIPVADSLRRQLDGSPGGAAVCVYHEGEVVVDLWGGLRDATGSPWQRDTMSPSFSTTKGVAATVVHILADRRVIDYDARVADYWPEFAQAGKHAITVRHVLAHQSGLYHIRQMIDRADRMLDWEFMVRAIERATPVHEPGKRTGYHGLTFGYLVGELVRRATGRPFSQVVREEIAEPLALDGLYIGAPEDALARVAARLAPRSIPRDRRGRGMVGRHRAEAARSRGRRARSPEHPRRARAARDRRVRLRRPGDAARRDPGRERALHRALARAHVRVPRGRRRDRRRAAPVARGASPRDRGAAAGGEPRRHPLRHALAPRVPRRLHDARRSAPRVRALRIRRIGRVGGPQPRPRDGAHRQQRPRDAVRRLPHRARERRRAVVRARAARSRARAARSDRRPAARCTGDRRNPGVEADARRGRGWVGRRAGRRTGAPGGLTTARRCTKGDGERWTGRGCAS